mgnify:CR=1 FL=1|tara:strand:+ start:25 stop:345 length:321 start_codon:yes stop_codon:yes gene_type:complete
MDYKLLYRAANQYEANFIKGLLSFESIGSRLLGQSLSIGIGELPVDVTQIDIYVLKENFQTSKKIIDDYEKNLSGGTEAESWECLSCNKTNPGSFQICWNCSIDTL